MRREFFSFFDLGELGLRRKKKRKRRRKKEEGRREEEENSGLELLFGTLV